MGEKTQTGLMLMTIGFGLAILSIIIQEACITSILGIVILVLGIVGVIFIYQDRNSFSERHRKFVVNALALYIIVVILTILAIIITMGATFGVLNAVRNQTISSEATIELFNSMKNIIVLGVIISVAYGFARTFLIYELENKTGRILLYGALIAIITVSIVTAIIGYKFIDSAIASASTQTYLTIDDFESLSVQLNAMNIYDLLVIIPNVLYLIAFYIPYKELRKKAMEEAATRRAIAEELRSETQSSEPYLDRLEEIPTTPELLTCSNCGSSRVLVCRDGSGVCEDCKKVFKDVMTSKPNSDK